MEMQVKPAQALPVKLAQTTTDWSSMFTLMMSMMQMVMMLVMVMLPIQLLPKILGELKF
jgi:hypothetical protein